MTPTLTIDEATHELARREVLKAAATDLRNLADQIHRLYETPWPMDATLVADAQNTIKLVRESLAAINELGWPETKSPSGGQASA